MAIDVVNSFFSEMFFDTLVQGNDGSAQKHHTQCYPKIFPAVAFYINSNKTEAGVEELMLSANRVTRISSFLRGIR